jgi:hypothetical protein
MIINLVLSTAMYGVVHVCRRRAASMRAISNPMTVAVQVGYGHFPKLSFGREEAVEGIGDCWPFTRRAQKLERLVLSLIDQVNPCSFRQQPSMNSAGMAIGLIACCSM